MCEKCEDLDRSIDLYGKVMASINNPVAIERIERFVREMVDRKAQLHAPSHPHDPIIGPETHSVFRF
jgi:hypothetical protein